MMIKSSESSMPGAYPSPIVENGPSRLGAARDLAWWLLSPYAYPTTVLALRTRRRVLLGPFAGMRYPFAAVIRMGFAGPAQVGCYECELHDAVEEIVASGPERVINVGAGAGYYAVGLARALPEAEVIAYETDPARRAAVSRLASLNGVEARVGVRGTCTPATLAELGSELELERRSASVVMDCEGAESELLEPDSVGWLSGASVLVELHPTVDPEIAAKLEQLLRPTHETRLIAAQPRWSSQFYEVWELPALREIDRELLVSEFRHGIQQWLWATPRER